MVLSNNHWGAPLYWRDTQSNKQVRFTADGKYYEKQGSENSFTLIGDFEVTAEDQMTITQEQPAFPEYPSYTLRLFF